MRTATQILASHIRLMCALPSVWEACMVPLYVVLAVPPSLVGVAAVLAVIRAKKEDLPAIVRALMRMGPRSEEASHGRRGTPPSLPKP